MMKLNNNTPPGLPALAVFLYPSNKYPPPIGSPTTRAPVAQEHKNNRHAAGYFYTYFL
jgi:hypothetical protein